MREHTWAWKPAGLFQAVCPGDSGYALCGPVPTLSPHRVGRGCCLMVTGRKGEAWDSRHLKQNGLDPGCFSPQGEGVQQLREALKILAERVLILEHMIGIHGEWGAGRRNG